MVAALEETRMRHGSTPVMDALVEWILGLEAASLPPAVEEAAGRSLTDWLGTAIRGSAEPLAEAIARVIRASGGEPQATVVGRGIRTSALMASLANGAQSHALDFDDTHLPSIVHGSAPVAPVVVALGEWLHASGAVVLAAFVAGFEVETRIGRLIGRPLADRGWHVTGILGHLGAAAAAGKLLDLDAGRLAHALGIAATQAAGLEQSFGTMSKPLHPGKAAMNGLLAALLAREGFTGSTAVLDGPGGLAATFLGVTTLRAAVEDLGKRFEILDNSTKPYAAFHLTHATIDAARALRARLGEHTGTVEAVRCRVHPLVLKVANQPAPRTDLEAKFSVAYCAALGLVHGEAGEAEFAVRRLHDPDVARVMAHVTSESDHTLGVGAARMTVRLADGRELEESVTAARGTAENPLTREELEAKFRRLAGVVLPKERAARLVERLRRLADVRDVAELAALAVPSL
jgi:2-methylcitrate dehydratase PrpD